MIEEISSLLFQTFSAQGGDANAQIQNAVQRLDGYGGSPEFCQCMFQIIQSDQIPQSIKNAAIIYIKNMILQHWSDAIHPQSKMIIICSLPSILLNINGTSYPLLNKLTASVVRKTFFTNEWNVLPIILSGFESQNDHQFLISLILLNSVSLLFSQVPDERLQVYCELSTQFLAILTRYISGSPSLFYISICFKIACHFSKSQIPPLFQSSPENLQIWLSWAMKIAEPLEDPNYNMFCLSSLKFLTLIFYKYEKMSLLPPETPMNMLNSVVSCISTGPDMKILGKCAYFLKLAIRSKYTWPDILSDLANFIKNVILQFYILTPSDMNDAINDPQAFVQNFHSCCIDGSDPRSTITNALERQSDVSPELRTTIAQLVNSIAPLRSPEYDQITFSVCFLFSTVSRHIHNANEVNSFCTMMLPLLQSQSFIVRCGALLAMRDIRNIPVPIVLSAFSMLSSKNEVLLVKYYSSIALSSFLSNIDEQNKQAIRSQMDVKNISVVISSYFLLAQEFNDFDFIDLIKAYIRFFGPNLLQIAPSFVAETYNMFLNFSRKQSHATAILSSLSQFLNLLNDMSQKEVLNQTIIFLLNQIMNTIKSNILLPHAIISVSDFVVNLIALSPMISELHWQIMSLFTELLQFAFTNSNQNSNTNQSFLNSVSPSSNLPNFSFTSESHSFLLESVCMAYKNLIIKDSQTATKPEIANGLINTAASMILSLPDLKEAGPPFSFLSTLLVILTGSEAVNLSELYNKLVPIVVNGLSVEVLSSYSTILFGALIFFNPNYLFSILNDKKSQVLLAWAKTVKKSTVTSLIVVINKKYQFFTNEELAMLITKAIFELKNLSASNINFDQFANLDVEPICIDLIELSVFNDRTVMEEFGNVLNLISTSCPAIIQQVQSSFEVPIQQIILEAIQSCS